MNIQTITHHLNRGVGYTLLPFNLDVALGFKI